MAGGGAGGLRRIVAAITCLLSIGLYDVSGASVAIPALSLCVAPVD